MSAAIAMNPREAAKAKGYIDSVISLTKTKLLPQVPEMTIRFVHSVGVDTFPMATSFCRYNEGSRQGCPDPDVAADRCEAWSRADHEGVASSAGKGRGVPEGVPL